MFKFKFVDLFRLLGHPANVERNVFLGGTHYVGVATNCAPAKNNGLNTIGKLRLNLYNFEYYRKMLI